jgi:DNA-binding PadR family transcriptional regulator
MTEKGAVRKGVPGSLSEPWFHILLALAEGPKHGYAIMQEVRERSSGGYRLWPATLYTAVKRMLAEELIEETNPPSKELGEDERRRFYRLTRQGRKRLETEANRMDALVREARVKKVLPAD